MTTRIAVFGPESTGKTTLARRLATHFDAPLAAEYVRAFWDAHHGQISASDLDAIARGQIQNEHAAGARGASLLICDTELITNTLWADVLFPGHCPDWVRTAADARSQRYALYLFCDTDIGFVDDGQRCFPDAKDRARCRRIWMQALTDRALPVATIRGTPAARFDTAVTVIQKTMSA